MNIPLLTTNYTFKNPQLLDEALTHKSFSSQHNERLEFLGDAILGACISESLFQRYPALDEGKLSRFRAELVKGKSLAEIAKQIGLEKSLKLGNSEDKHRQQLSKAILADAFEALIAAIYLDSDYATCRSIVLELFKERLDRINTEDAGKDAKTTLQEWLQARNFALPQYTLIATFGPEHQQLFQVRCDVIDLHVSTLGESRTKKQAEQKSAQTMLELLNEKHG